jgi:TolB-like protein
VNSSPRSLVVGLLAVLLLAASPSLAEKKHAGPFAVMPFKNLNNADALEWLRVGIAETMISDLRRSGLPVVERDQLDRALAEIALQSSVGNEASAAAKVGRMVGARTVVVGGYQKAGSKIRITARFVSVETGVVRDTAKTTGALSRIFALQDEIVERLIGRKPAPRKRAAKKKRASGAPKAAKAAKGEAEAESPDAAGRTIDAYRLYSLSLVTSSQADRVKFLKRAIELDPSFHYALEDLAKLEQRLEHYAKTDDRIRRERSARGLDAITDLRRSGDERVQLAYQLMMSDLQGARYRELQRAAQQVYSLDDLPRHWGMVDVKETASYYIVFSHQMLKEKDLALQAGERHLKEFPGGQFQQAVRILVKTIIREKRQADTGAKKYAKELEELEEDRAEFLENPRNMAYRPARLRSFDMRRCTAAQSHQQWETAVVECERWMKKHRNAEGDDVEGITRNVRFALMWAYAQQGKFKAARTRAKHWQDEDPEGYDQMSVATIIETWPR